MKGITDPLNRELERRLQQRRHADLVRWAEEQKSLDDEALDELEQLVAVTPDPAQAQPGTVSTDADENLDVLYQSFRHLARELAKRNMTANDLQDLQTIKSWYKVTATIAEQVMESLTAIDEAIKRGPSVLPKPTEQ